MAVNYIYPGTGTGADVHPYATPSEQGISQPFNLANPLNAAEGPGRYSDNMWSQLETLHDAGLQMTLLEQFRRHSIYAGLVPTTVNMAGRTGALAQSMTVKGVLDMEPNYSPVGTRQIWFNSNYSDTFEKTIEFESYADKVALHEFDDKVQAFLFNGQTGMQDIARTLLGGSMTTALDYLARNAFLDANQWYSKIGGTVTSGTGNPTFAGIGAVPDQDLFDLNLSRDIWRMMSYAGIPMASNPTGVAGNIFCVTTPDTVKVVKDDNTSDWFNTNLYANPEMLLRYEIGLANIQVSLN